MKKPYMTKRVGAGLAALAALFTLSPRVSALPLTWLDGPQAGQAFNNGTIVIKAINYDTGTLYNALPVGTSAGYTGSPGAGVAGGEATLNALPGQRSPINGQPNEDSWGIVKITDILAVASDGLLHNVYNHIASPYELTAVFWGIHDFYLNQISAGSGLPGAGQVIDGTGMRVDIYSDPSKNFNPLTLGGPGGRTGPNGYTTATDGTLELSLQSTSGFINANGTFGGAATEFESNTANVGYAALNVTNGSASTRPQFDTNGIGFGGSYGSSFAPGLVTNAADVWFSFTSTQGQGNWDITSNDPMLANITSGQVPDSGSSLMMLAGGLALLGVAFRYRKQIV
jgi:hypothetical protein